MRYVVINLFDPRYMNPARFFQHLHDLDNSGPAEGRGVGGGLKRTRITQARAGWPRRVALVRVTLREEVDVIGVQQC